jgi:DUF1365 family protein
MSDLASALYVGDVRHRRHRPARNAFRYRVYHVLIDLDELPRLDRELRWFGHDRAAVTSFHDRDHLDASGRGLRAELAGFLAAHDRRLPDGPVRVLTNLRVLGHVFNPVSWWFCHEPDGRLALVVAEVHNTFGERYRYLLDDLEHRDDGTVRARAGKAFHVSPFLPIDGLDYRFVLRPPGAQALAHIDVWDAEGRVLDATQRGVRRELTDANLRRVLLTHPLVTLRTVALIHLQAVRLWSRRVPFHRKPATPDDRPAIPDVAHAEPVPSRQEPRP